MEDLRKRPSFGSRTSDEEKSTKTRPRVLLADDLPPWLERVSSLLKSDYELVGTVSNGAALVNEAKRLEPDLIILDISMPQLNGIEAAHMIHDSRPEIRLVFLTVHEQPEYIRACFAEGALAFVRKSRLGTDLIPAIQAALLGRPFISSQVGC